MEEWSRRSTLRRCLLIYPNWQDDIQRKVEALLTRLLEEFKGSDRTCDRYSYGPQRALLVPPLREYARLSKNAVLLGQGNKWNCGTKRSGLSEESSGLTKSLKLSFQRTEIFIVIRKADVGARSCSP